MKIEVIVFGIGGEEDSTAEVLEGNSSSLLEGIKRNIELAFRHERHICFHGEEARAVAYSATHSVFGYARLGKREMFGYSGEDEEAVLAAWTLGFLSG